MQRRLERSTTNRVFAGVCGGLADYLSIDPTLLRVFFVIATFVTAFLFVLAYIVLLILIPLPGQRPPIDDLWPSARTGDVPPPAASSVVEGEAPAALHGLQPKPDAVFVGGGVATLTESMFDRSLSSSSRQSW